MAKIEITLRKSNRTKRIDRRTGDALVQMGLARYARRDMVAETASNPAISRPVPPPAAPVIPPEAEAAAAIAGGEIVTPESRAAGEPAPVNDGAQTEVPAPIDAPAPEVDPVAQTSDPPEHVAQTPNEEKTRGRRARKSEPKE